MIDNINISMVCDEENLNSSIDVRFDKLLLIDWCSSLVFSSIPYHIIDIHATYDYNDNM
jgi:hypothetical protein